MVTSMGWRNARWRTWCVGLSLCWALGCVDGDDGDPAGGDGDGAQSEDGQTSADGTSGGDADSDASNSGTAGTGEQGDGTTGGPVDAGVLGGGDQNDGDQSDGDAGTTVATDASTDTVPGTDTGGFDCTRPETIVLNEPSVVTAVSGDNGSFQDACTASGQLTQYRCELIEDPECPPPVFPNPAPCPQVPTGQVESFEVDCDGQCEAGTCRSRCPDFDDPVELLSNDGTIAHFTNANDPREMQCELIFDQATDTVDCSSVAPGTAGVITSLGFTGYFPYCAGGTWGNIGVCFDGDCAQVLQNCSYSCVFTY